ncbi:MAG: DUF4416 family protein [Candidatus Omnitrophota bacterium]
MAKARNPENVKLIIGLISKKEYLESVIGILKKKIGAIDFYSDVFNFTHTDYYFKEMGSPLCRQFISFKKLVSPVCLWKMKRFTNKLENKFLKEGRRQINIDPGYLNFSKLVLASAKDFAHRIYLNKGIYAEITLIYQNEEYQKLEWTFPDYASETYRRLFKEVRNIYAKQVKERKNIG